MFFDDFRGINSQNGGTHLILNNLDSKTSSTIVYIRGGTRPVEPQNETQLRTIFSDMKGIPINVRNSNKSWLDIIKDFYPNNPQTNILIVDNNVTTLLNKDDIRDLLRSLELESKSSNIDVFFLSSWGDHCQMRRYHSKLNDKFSLYGSQHPRGLQAIFIPYNKISKVLGNITKNEWSKDDDLSSLIYDGRLNAGVVVPQPFSLNIEMIDDNTDYQKMNPCKILNVGVRNLPEKRVIPARNDTLTYFIIVIILALLFFALTRVNMGKKK